MATRGRLTESARRTGPAAVPPRRTAGPGLPAYRRAEDRHHVPAAGDVAEPGRRWRPRASCCPAITRKIISAPARICAASRSWPSDPAGSWTGEWEILATPGQAGAAASRSSRTSCSRPRTRQQAERAVKLAPAGRGAHRAHGARHGHAAARRVAGDGEAPQRAGLGGLARRRDRPRVGVRRTGASGGSGACTTRSPSWTCGRAHVPADRMHVITAPPRGADTGAALGPVRGPARRGSGERRPQPGAGQRLARPAGDRVPAAPEPGAARRGARLVLHVEREGGAGARGAGRAARGRRAWCCPADRAAWAQEHAEALISGLRESAYDIVGDLDELRPQPGRAGREPGRPAGRRRCWTRRCRPRPPWC